jgi:hypothetical protein
MQKLVGGFIEGLELEIGGQNVPAYGNDEAKLLDMHCNVVATTLYRYRGYDYLAGDIVVTGDIDRDGNETSISPEIVELILAQAKA